MSPRRLVTQKSDGHPTHHSSYTLGPRLAGGYQDGAYDLVNGHGQHHVLKLRYAPRAISLIQHLSARGYPTPDILFSGQIAEDTPYVVQTFLPGTPLTTLTPALVEQLIPIIDQQANCNPKPQEDWHQSWSRYAHAVLFANESHWSMLIHQTSSATAQLIERIEQLTAPFEGLMLPNTDIVHGDFNVENVLADHSQITGIIDMLYAGYGTRAIDLATLLHFAYTHEYGVAVRERLHEHIRSIVGHEGLCVCLSYRIIAMLAWAIERDREAIDLYVRHGWQIVRDLSV